MNQQLKVREITMVGLAVALMGVFSQLTIPLPTVPLTLQVFGVILLASILGSRLAVWTTLIYILTGCIGIPVFSNFSRGVSVLVGPTGGYIIGFIVLGYIVGKSSEQANKVYMMLAAYVGLILQYTMGTIQLKIVLGVSMQEALVIGVYPFIVKDLILTAVAVTCAVQIRKKLSVILTRQIKY